MKNLLLAFSFLVITVQSYAGTTYLKLTCLLEGYYLTGSEMVPAAVNQGCPWAVPNLADRVLVQLRSSVAPFPIVAQAIANLPTSGIINSITLSHPNLVSGNYFIVVKNTRCHIETWSKAPVPFTLNVTSKYDFTRDPASAYGNNMKKVGPTQSGYPLGVWAFYAGDVDHDGCVIDADYDAVQDDVNNFVSGCVTTDINGDGNVDLLDLPIVDANRNSLICLKKP